MNGAGFGRFGAGLFRWNSWHKQNSDWLGWLDFQSPDMRGRHTFDARWPERFNMDYVNRPV
jgi:hypothetical protein